MLDTLDLHSVLHAVQPTLSRTVFCATCCTHTALESCKRPVTYALLQLPCCTCPVATALLQLPCCNCPVATALFKHHAANNDCAQILEPTASHSRLSLMRWRFPGVPENWKVACTTYGCRPITSAMRCTKKVCPLQKVDTGKMPMRSFPSKPLNTTDARSSFDLRYALVVRACQKLDILKLCFAQGNQNALGTRSNTV